MWVASKTVDNGLVPKLKLVVALRPALFEKSLGQVVNLSRFAVHIRHLEKHSLIARQNTIHPCCNRLLRQGQHKVIGSKGERLAAIHVS
jgi:hypothetical protein